MTIIADKIVLPPSYPSLFQRTYEGVHRERLETNEVSQLETNHETSARVCTAAPDTCDRMWSTGTLRKSPKLRSEQYRVDYLTDSQRLYELYFSK